MAAFLHAADDACGRAIAAADALFENPFSDPDFDPDTPESARAAVERFGSRFAEVPGVFTAALEGARAGAQVMSGDRLQGLAEVVQNADDVGARRVRFLLDGNELLVAHDGRPATLREVLALAMPWLTTKSDDPSATGRFGIGLMTLQALSGTLEVFSGPYGVRLGDPTIAAIEKPDFPEGFAAPTDTVLRVPLERYLLGAVELAAWASRWDEAALLFCRQVAEVAIAAGDLPRRLLCLQWEERPPGRAQIGGSEVTVRRRYARAPDGRCWSVHVTDASPPAGVGRAHKAVEDTIPLGVALALHGSERGEVYAGLPVCGTRYAVRVNTQFDPLTNRQGIARTAWNDALFPMLTDLWAAAVIDLFEVEPAAAWHAVPLPQPDEGSAEDPIYDFELLLLTRARTALPEQLSFPVDGRTFPLADLAVEAPRLEGILSDGEIAALAGLQATLPAGARDHVCRWRAVIDDWRHAGARLADPVTVEAALELVDDDTRTPEATIALAAAALDEGLGTRLVGLCCVVAEDGTHLRPPTATEPRMLVIGEVGIAGELGVAHRFHLAHLGDTTDARKVLLWLEERNAITDATDIARVLGRLAAVGQAGGRFSDPLTDGQLRALRDGFERLSPTEGTEFGSAIGRAILIGAYYFDRRGKKRLTAAHPADSYLPRTLDREPDSFAVAAGSTIGLIWIQGRYADVLRSRLGRSGLGAQRFLRLLGARTAPRIIAYPDLDRRYASDRRRGLHRSADGSPPGRFQALRSLGATYTLDDTHSPDLVAVLTAIGRDRKATRRRQRAAAMLATLGRAWDRLGDLSEVIAATDYYGWQTTGSVKAMWVWQAATIPWLDDENATPTQPTDLRVRTPGTVAVHGPSAPGYLHGSFHHRRHDVLGALGVTGEPGTTELIERLRALRDASPNTETVAADAGVIYQALADRLATRGHNPGDMSPAELRQAFAAGTGLVRTNRGWHPPAQVLAGKPVFGDRRPFTPQVPDTDRLWSTLHIRQPSIDDCIAVLREIARTGSAPNTADQAVLLETMRLLSELMAQRTMPSIARRLAGLPLWTSHGWKTKRPVYAIDDLILAEGIAAEVPVWQPGGELSQFRGLLRPLRLTEVDGENATVLHADAAEPDEEATDLFRLAVPLLREDLIRNEPTAEAALELDWEHLRLFQVRVAADLRVRVSGLAASRSTVIEVTARVDPGATALYLTDPALLTRVDGGGRAVAALFAADRRRVAHAWLAACDGAEAGRKAHRLQLASERAAEDEAKNAADIAVRLDAFSRYTEAAHARRRPGGRPSGPPPPAVPTGPVPPISGAPVTQTPAPRNLVDPARLRVADPRGRVVGPAPGAGGGADTENGPAGRLGGAPPGLPTPRHGGATPHEAASPRSYTDLGKESIGLDLVRKVLASDAEEMKDLRAQHGVGADAVDALERFFELKVYAGPEPDRITLEKSQIRRAMTTPEFFLVIVSGVEGSNTMPRVRIIVDPLKQLTMTETSSVCFTGVRVSRGVVYSFVPYE